MSYIVYLEFEGPNMEVSNVFVGPFTDSKSAQEWLDNYPKEADTELVGWSVAYVNDPSEIKV